MDGQRRGWNAALGRDASGSQHQRPRRPIDDGVGYARRLDGDKIGDRADTESPLWVAERLIRLAGRQREGVREFAVGVHLVPLGDDCGAIEHVAVAKGRPAVADIVGAGEHRDAAGAKGIHRGARARTADMRS